MSSPCASPKCANRKCTFLQDFETRFEDRVIPIEMYLKSTGRKGPRWIGYLREERSATILAVTKALLPHLPDLPFYGGEQIRASCDSRFVQTVGRILILLEALVRNTCGDPLPRPRAQEISNIIAPRIGSILSWKWFCTSSGDADRRQTLSDAVELWSLIIHLLLISCDELSAQIFCSHDAMDALLVVYASHHDRYGRLFTEAHFVNLLLVLNLHILHNSSRRLFQRGLAALTPYRLRSFAKNLKILAMLTAQRAAQVRAGYNDPMGVKQGVRSYENLILVLNHVVPDQKINEVFLVTGLLTETMSLAMSMRQIYLKTGAPSEQVDESTDNLTTIFLWAMHYRTSGWKLIRDFLTINVGSRVTWPGDPSLLEIFLQEYKQLARSGIFNDAIGPMFLFISNYFGSGGVLRAVEAAYQRLDERDTRIEENWDARNGMWNFFKSMYVVWTGSSQILRQEGQAACANIHHWNSRRGSTYEGAMKTCTGCLSVMYCSRECQAEDWDRVHQRECMLLAREYQDMTSKMLIFPRRARIQTMVCFAIWTNSSSSFFWEGLDVFIQQLADPVCRSGFVYIWHTLIGSECVGRHPRPHDRLVPIEGYEEWARGLVSGFHKERFDLLVEAVLQHNAAVERAKSCGTSDSGLDEGTGKRLQLVSFAIPYGSSRWHILCAYTVPDSRNDYGNLELTLGLMLLDTPTEPEGPPQLDESNTPCVFQCCRPGA
ncbi:hypothetical protein BKA70DRAFT_1413977 [Coprinopsis sp. MPI-PUGE-AT-0042]|nr:hypothetical protein BKA70DRAFT_1413977 [Coprinopsis sp. MPI-PUGE-AT-0042]